MDGTTDFQLLSAMRYDETRPWKSLLSPPLRHKVDAESPILLLSYHRDRLANAGDAFGWIEAAAKLRENTTCELILYLARSAIEKERSISNDQAAYKASEQIWSEVPLSLSVLLFRLFKDTPRSDLSCIVMGS